MISKKKIKWMEDWCSNHGLTLELDGECGFGRECVGIMCSENECFPDYTWHDEQTYKRLDNNGDVWTPEDAYHKHPCVAVLGKGNKSIEQLYKWLCWFDENNFTFELIPTGKNDHMSVIFGKNKHARLVRPDKEEVQ